MLETYATNNSPEALLVRGRLLYEITCSLDDAVDPVQTAISQLLRSEMASFFLIGFVQALRSDAELKARYSEKLSDSDIPVDNQDDSREKKTDVTEIAYRSIVRVIHERTDDCDERAKVLNPWFLAHENLRRRAAIDIL